MELKMDHRTPHADINDPQEQRIRAAISDLVTSNDFGKDAVASVKSAQIKYFTKALTNLDQEDIVYNSTQEVLTEIANITNTKIVEGGDLVENLRKGEPVLVALNHFGFNKLVTISPEEIGFKKDEVVTSSGEPILEIYPFPTYYAPLKPVADKLNLTMSEAHLVLPNSKLATLQGEAGLVVIPEEKGEFELITNRTMDIISKHHNSLIAIFPEGKTSGKGNNSHPYDLMPFHSGLWGISTEMSKKGISVPVVTAYQYWNPESGFEVGIVGIDFPKPTDSREQTKQYAIESQQKMQNALNKRMQS